MDVTKDKSSSFKWQDWAIAASLGLTTVVCIKVFLGSHNNGNGHSAPRNGHGRGPPMLPPPDYDGSPPGMPPGAIPYTGIPPGGRAAPPPMQRRVAPPGPQQQQGQFPPGYRQVPPNGGPPGGDWGEPTPGSQNTVGRAVLTQNEGGYYNQPTGMMVHDRRGVRMANNL